MAKKIERNIDFEDFTTDFSENPTDVEITSTESIVKIPIELIDIGENIRTIETDDELLLDDLAQTIKEYGQLQPVIVYKNNDRYTIEMGSRRYKACVKLGIPTLDCIVREGFKDEKERIITQAIENEHRKQMTAAEREKYIQKLSDMGMKDVEICKALRVSKSWITQSRKAFEARKDFEFIPDNASTTDTYNASNLEQKQIDELKDFMNQPENKGNSKNFKKKLSALTKPKHAENTESKNESDNSSIPQQNDSSASSSQELERQLDDITFAIENELEINDEQTNEYKLRINMCFTINDENKTLTFNDNEEDFDSDIQKFVLRQIKNYYMEKGYNVD